MSKEATVTYLRYCHGIFPERIRKTMKNLSQDSRSPGRDFNPGPPEHEVWWQIVILIQFANI
jgi:hypothetical protein